jgi:hypothetical protein
MTNLNLRSWGDERLAIQPDGKIITLVQYVGAFEHRFVM